MPEVLSKPREASSASSARLLISGGDLPSHVVPLSASLVVIGRSADCDIRLDRSTVSRRHAELFRDPFGRWWIRDLGSRNGIRFGEQRVSERALRPGDALGLGEFVLRFETSASELHPPSTMTIVPTSDVAAQIYNIEQMEPPRIAAKHLSVLIEFGRELLDIDDDAVRKEKLCKLMVEPEFGGQFSLVLLSRGGEGNVVCGPVSAPNSNGSVRVSQRLVDAVRQTGRAALASSTASSPDVVQMTIASPQSRESAVACPIGAGSELLYVGLPPERGTAEWLAVASMAAEQYRSAEAAWAARHEAQSHAAIEQELRQARDLQLRLVPKDVQIPGLELAITFLPCRWVCGDYVVARELGDGRVLLTVADVCGKGMAAALVSSSLHTMLFASLRGGADLCAVTDALNSYLLEVLKQESFVTMACVLLDPKTGKMQCANAGHPPPMVIRAGGAVRELPSALSLPLGIEAEPIICRDDQLEPGELLVLYSDGLSELTLADGQMLGIPGLGSELSEAFAATADQPVDQLNQRMQARFHELQHGRFAQDDITLLLARRS